MKNEEKVQQIIGGGCNRQDCHECGGSLSVAEGCVEFIHLKEMAEWKDYQIRDILLKYTLWLNKRGFFADGLQCDFGHQIDTFLEINKEE